MAESPSPALPGGVQWLPAMGGAHVLRVEFGRGEPPALVLQSARTGEHRIEPGPRARFNRTADFLVPAGLSWTVAVLVWEDGARVTLPGPPDGRAEVKVIDLASRRPTVAPPPPAQPAGPEPLPWTAPPIDEPTDAAAAAEGFEVSRAELDTDLSRAAEAISHARETERATGEAVQSILAGARADLQAERAARASDLSVLTAESQLADLRAELERARAEITELRSALETERIARTAAESALGSPVPPGALTELASQQAAHAAATAPVRPTEEADRLVAALEAAASSLRATIPTPADVNPPPVSRLIAAAASATIANPTPSDEPATTNAGPPSAHAHTTSLPGAAAAATPLDGAAPAASEADRAAASPFASTTSANDAAASPSVADEVAPFAPTTSANDAAASPSVADEVAPFAPATSANGAAAQPSVADEVAPFAPATSANGAAAHPSVADEVAPFAPATAASGVAAQPSVADEVAPFAPAVNSPAAVATAVGVVPPTPDGTETWAVPAPSVRVVQEHSPVAPEDPADAHRPVLVASVAARAAAQAAAEALRTVSEPAPGLRRALVELAREDSLTAGALLAGLLPAQGAVLDEPLSYDLTVRGHGTFAVTVGDGGAEVQRIAKRRPRKEAAFHIAGEPLMLAELLAGDRTKLGRFRSGARITGRRRRAKPLRALPSSSLTLAEAVAAGARLEPSLVYAALPYAVAPEWTRGHVFTVAQEITELGPRAWYVTARDGVRLSVVEHAAGAAADATVTMSRAAFDRLLKGEPAAPGDLPVIRGDRTAVATLKRWTDLARA